MNEFFGILSSVFGAAGILTIPIAMTIIIVLKSMRNIGPMEVGLVRKRFGWTKNTTGSPVSLSGEAGYQADLLMTGLRFKLWPLYDVSRHPFVQIPAGQIGVVIAQVGKAPEMGAKSGVYKTAFGNFEDIRTFMGEGGEKGVQRPVLPPGTVAPIHPIGFLVITAQHVYGEPVADEYAHLAHEGKGLTHDSFGLTEEQLQVVRIKPKQADREGHIIDMVGIVTTLEGTPSPKGAMANRIGDFGDIVELEAKDGEKDSELVEAVLESMNQKHNSYQDFQKFLDVGGRIGLQHDPLLYGAYNLNPFLVSVELVPMLVVNQGQVAVMKAYVGLATVDMSGTDFKFGSLVRPGHRGIWQEPLRTGKFAVNPRAYAWEIVPTFILTLNWASASSQAHNLDSGLSSIVAKSKEGFEFTIDLQVQIHVPDSEAPKVISIVGSMQNLVNEVLQAAVGNHFRDTLQKMPAIDFIQKRNEVQAEAQTYITNKLREYHIEVRGVYIQDVVLPADLVTVLKQREIANQQKATYDQEKIAQDARLELEAARGRADEQAALAKSEVGVKKAENEANAVKATAAGEAYRLTEVGRAKAVETEAEGLAVAKGLEAQQKAIGSGETMAVNIAKALSHGVQRFMPETLAITVGDGGGNGIGALVPSIMKFLQNGNIVVPTAKPDAEKPAVPVVAPAAQNGADHGTPVKHA